MEAFVIFFSALWDKEGFDLKRLRRVLDEMNEYADSIRNGYVTIQDLHAALKEEGIELVYYHDTTGGPVIEREMSGSANFLPLPRSLRLHLLPSLLEGFKQALDQNRLQIILPGSP